MMYAEFFKEVYGFNDGESLTYSYKVHEALLEYDNMMNLMDPLGNIRNTERYIVHMAPIARKWQVSIENMKKAWRGLDAHREWKRKHGQQKGS